MKKTLPLLTVLAAILMGACNKATMSRLQEQNDSLTWVNSKQQQAIDHLELTIGEITQTLSAIAASEREVLTGVDEHGNRLTRRNLGLKLERLRMLIREQHARLDSLSEAFDESSEMLVKLRAVVNMLTMSLDAKMREIDSLHTELTFKDISIINLGTEIQNLNDTVEDVRKENVAHRKTIAEQTTNIGRQDAQLHEVYYIIATKEQLIEANVLTKEGGLFKKMRVNFSGLEKSWLTSADIRTLKHIDIPSKTAKILSEVPEMSYKLDYGESSCSLDILDAEKFWSSNNRVLVIQTN